MLIALGWGNRGMGIVDVIFFSDGFSYSFFFIVYLSTNKYHSYYRTAKTMAAPP